MGQITIQDSRSKHRKLSLLAEEGKFGDVSEVYSSGADLLLLVYKATKITNPRSYNSELLRGYVHECLKIIKSKDFSILSKKLRELSLALKLRTLISPSDDSRQAYLNLSDIFGNI